MPDLKKLGIPTDYKTYWKRVPKHCFTSKGKKQSRARAGALGLSLEEYKSLSVAQRRTRWDNHLKDVYMNQIVPATTARAIKLKQKATINNAKRKQKKLDRRRERNKGMSTNGRMIASMKGRLRVVYGSARSGKTHAIITLMINNCFGVPGWTNAIIGHTFPHMEKEGAMADFMRIMKDLGLWEQSCWKKQARRYEYPNGSVTHFISAWVQKGTPGQAFDEAFFNEWDRLSYAWEYFMAIFTRAKSHVWCDFNPARSFQFNTDILPHAEKFGLDLLEKLNYKGNEYLTAEQIAGVEANAFDPVRKRIYIDGEFGDIDFMIFPNWKMLTPRTDDRGNILELVPHDAKLVSRGLDFGGFNMTEGRGHSKMALVNVYRYNGGYIFDQEIYAENMMYDTLAGELKKFRDQVPVYADRDNAGILHLVRHGVTTIRPADKRKGSVQATIKYIQERPIWVTQRSVDLWDERSQYVWKEDVQSGIQREEPNGKTPQDLIDACRYGIQVDYKFNTDMEQEGFDRLNQYYSGGGIGHDPLSGIEGTEEPEWEDVHPPNSSYTQRFW